MRSILVRRITPLAVPLCAFVPRAEVAGGVRRGGALGWKHSQMYPRGP